MRRPSLGAADRDARSRPDETDRVDEATELATDPDEEGEPYAERVAIRRVGRWIWRVVHWRSTEDQPAWARPTLLGIALLAGLSYGWNPDGTALEPFYAAAARSMSQSWANFAFASVDPRGTISVDKLPGALFIQALAVRAFGFHVWAVALPQAVEGVLTILVLYRAVRALAGAKPAIVSCVVLAASPVTVLLNRGNVSDSLLILLTVLAADAVGRAIVSGRLRTVVLSGVWVGLAFQAKMIQAWIVLPALFVAYVMAAPPRLSRRLAHVIAAGAVCVAVSLSWMSAVSLVNPSSRPYVDGSNDDSLFTQVFIYNGTSRIGIGAGADLIKGPRQPFLAAAQESNPQAGTYRIPPSWHRLLSGPFGRDDGWLLPAAGLSAVAVLVSTRRRRRTNRIRAALVLWGGWLVLLFGFFSSGTFLNSYYMAALMPAVAALCGLGFGVAWRARRHDR